MHRRSHGLGENVVRLPHQLELGELRSRPLRRRRLPLLIGFEALQSLATVQSLEELRYVVVVRCERARAGRSSLGKEPGPRLGGRGKTLLAAAPLVIIRLTLASKGGTSAAVGLGELVTWGTS
jgi:hypothetical protein